MHALSYLRIEATEELMALTWVQEIPLDAAAWHCGTAHGGPIAGRIDHFAIDAERKRLFVACLGNNTVEVVDAYAGAKIHTLGRLSGDGLASPTGLCFVRGAALREDRLYVANAGGFVSIFSGAALEPQTSADHYSGAPPKRIAVPDADNLRYLPSEGLVLVGCGDGEVAAISVATDELCLRETGGGRLGWALEAHPESFQVVSSGGDGTNTPACVIANVADTGTVVALPFPIGAPAAWTLRLPEVFGANFAMAVNSEAGHALVITRRAPALFIIDAHTGSVLEGAIEPSDAVRCVSDADDVFFDDRRRRVYVIGGAGRVSVYQFTPASTDAEGRSVRDGRYTLIQEVDSAIGARTGVWYAERHRLYVAAPATSTAGARLLVYEATSA